jgi:hypothetical protein
MSAVSSIVKALQMELIWGYSACATSLIAMQKVEGSNPFSRFFGNALHRGGLGLARIAETRSNHPRISSPFWALVPKTARMRSD